MSPTMSPTMSSMTITFKMSTTSVASAAFAASSVSGSLSVTATAEDKEIMCLEDELAVDGLTWLALTTALDGSGVPMADAAVGPLTCSDSSRLRGRRMESVSFDLVFTVSISDSVGGADFSSAVGAAATALVTEFENKVASLLKVTVSAVLGELSVVTKTPTTNSTTQALATGTTGALNVSESVDFATLHGIEGISRAKTPFMSILVFFDVLLSMRSGVGIS